MILGIAPGFACCYLLGSERARVAYRRFSSAPAPVRQVTERISSAIGGTEAPDEVKQAATRVTEAVQTATEQAATRANEAVETASHRTAHTSARLSGVPLRGWTSYDTRSALVENGDLIDQPHDRRLPGDLPRRVAGQVRNNVLQVL